jgi:acyl transferase domain-containing protein/acyl carrier protein
MPNTELNQDASFQLRRALGAIRDLRDKLQTLETRAHEPVAIIGMSCRLPGAADLQTFWRNLVSGQDAIVEVPPERWDLARYYDPDANTPGKMNSRWGGFIENVYGFDPIFWGISPREALSIDPQHRLLLEGVWHALEHAGLAPDQLLGTATGVYLGLSTHDYAEILGDAPDTGWIDAHTSLGNSAAVAAGRIAYTLGLQGPALVVDTACSSSLVALHLACRALRAGDIPLAVAGGINLTLRPELTIGFSKAHMLAADGRCKTFDAAADGYVRGEGYGVVVLKRLSDAVAAGDRIHGVIRGSAVNQDGRSNGLTAPNGPAQAAVIRAALADAQVDAKDVSYIEAHGTGTALGDPIEARALSEVFAAAQAEETMWVGSVKTQIGHLEAAAGIAGLIKVVLALRHATLPPHLHFRTLNPHIANDGFPFSIPTQTTRWVSARGRRLAGVSSFGFSGTNAHVILEEAPEAKSRPMAQATGPWPLCLSAADPESLAALRAATCQALAAPGADLAQLAATLSAGRAQMAWRLGLVASDAAQAVELLGEAEIRHISAPPKIAFLFTGQGSQFPGMARELMEAPRFRQVIERCSLFLADRLERPLTELLVDENAPLDRTDLLQPALFAFEYALAELLQSWGIEPAAVLGHSMGEVVAACVAGAMPLEQGLSFVMERARQMSQMSQRGGMAAVFAPASTVSQIIADSGAEIAAYNGAENTVVSGRLTALEQALKQLGSAGIEFHRLAVATGFHSSAIDPCLDGLTRAAAAVDWRPTQWPVAANLTGRLIHRFDAEYWVKQARRPVAFTAGLQALSAYGCEVFIEIGPKPVLSALGKTLLPQALFLSTSRPDGSAKRNLCEALSRLYGAGVTLNWSGFWGADWLRIDAPLYPFRRESFRPPPQPETTAPAQGNLSEMGAEIYPLLGRRLHTPLPHHLFASAISPRTLPFLGDHVVFGELVVPGAMHAILALLAGRHSGIVQPVVEDLVFARALTLEEGGKSLHCVLEPSGDCTIYSQASDQAWVRHASAHLAASAETPPKDIESPAALRARLVYDEAGVEPFFHSLAERGIHLGPAFRGIQAIWRGDGEALVEIRCPDGLSDIDKLPLHPALLDACWQTLGATFSGAGTAGGFLPLSVDRIQVWRTPPRHFWCHVTTDGKQISTEVAIGHFRLMDDAGEVYASIVGLQIKRITPTARRDALATAHLGLDWVSAPLPEPDWAAPSILVPAMTELGITVPDDHGLADGLERLATAFAADALKTKPADIPAGFRQKLWQRVVEIAALDPAALDLGSAALLQQLRARYPNNGLEIDLLSRCGKALPGVLAGTAEPLQWILPTPPTDAATQPTENTGSNIYGDSALSQAANAMVAAALARAIARRRSCQVRILEVGAGSGATTAAVWSAIPAEVQVHYQFTDVSPAFLTAAEKTFAAQRGISFSLFDLERTPQEQGLPPGGFDVVIAANVVHATAAVRRSLEHLRELLAPGGLLILLESTNAQHWWDMVFGLTPGWWRFTDTDLRPHHPLLPGSTWSKLLEEQGFISPTVCAVDAQARQSIILAQAPWPNAFWILHDGASASASRQLANELAQTLARRQIACPVLSVTEALSQIEQSPVSGGVVYTGGLSLPGETSLRQAFELIRGMVANGRERLWLVTRAAQATGDVSVQPDGAMLWGLGKVAALEHPNLQCRQVDLEPAAPQAAEYLARELLLRDAEAEVAWRAGQRYASRLSPLPPSDTAAAAFDPQGSYLITGAFGGLGPKLAAWLAAGGAGHLLLIGRQPPSPAVTQELEALSAQVRLRVADVADRAALEALLAELDQDGPALRGVFHLAGGVADGALLKQDWARFSSILPAKVEGARHLHELTRGRALDYFVLFSTSAALIGNPGQANHAAANAFLDALAHARRAEKLPGLSINWGAWGEAGAVAEGLIQERLLASGAKPIPLQEGFAALGQVLSADRAQIGIIPADWPRFLAGYGAAIPAFFERLAAVPITPEVTAAPRATPQPPLAPTDLRTKVLALSSEERHLGLIQLLQGEAAAVLAIADPQRIDAEQPLSELGLDSLLALELGTRLSTATGCKLPATLLFNFPTISALASHLLDDVLDLADKPTTFASTSDEDDTLLADVAELSEADLEALIDDEWANLS